MTIKLYDYQNKLVSEALDQLDSDMKNVMIVAPTGAGKTIMMSELVRSLDCRIRLIAHRSELIIQMSCALARFGIKHNVIAPKQVVTSCVRAHLALYGGSFFHQYSRVDVASVQTLNNRNDLRVPDLWITDECAHVLRKNIWGQCLAQYPKASGIGFTATPLRLDGYGLGSKADGVFDSMIIGPTTRELINRGRLSEFIMYAPKCDIDFTHVRHTANGDFSQPELRDVTHKSRRLVADIVRTYIEKANGVRGLTFTVDVESAAEVAEKFNTAGIPAAVVSAKTPYIERVRAIDRFRKGEILQLCSVDILGEGVDIPDVGYVALARRTESFSLFCQNVGRGLRFVPGKQPTIICDHVGNIAALTNRYGPFDRFKNWSLLGERNKTKTLKPIIDRTKTCPECLAVYMAVLGQICPYCKTETLPVSRSKPENVDGDLSLLSFDGMLNLKKQLDAVFDEPKVPHGATLEIMGAIKKRHRLRLKSLSELRTLMLEWSRGKLDIPSAQRQFYHEFGIDVGTAQTLSKKEMTILIDKLNNYDL